ncbi:MAG TPA: hypothetical protein VGF67_26325 [Ktedonobacteraceae bacterium]|jgi:hypothetical protein
MVIDRLGAVLFGFIVGWLACRLLWQKTTTPWIHALIALGGTVAAAAVLALFGDTVLFGWYAIGLVLSLLTSVAVQTIPSGHQPGQTWREMLMGPAPTTTTATRTDTSPAYQQASKQSAEPAPIVIPAVTASPPVYQQDDTQQVRSVSTPAISEEAAVPEDVTGADAPPERKRGGRRSTSQRKRETDE